MGNRAVITFKNQPTVGIYLHWNGGRESVEAFLECAKQFKLRGDDYGVARLAQLIGNFFGGNLSIGVGLMDELDVYGNNGTYVVDEKWNIVDRLYIDIPDEPINQIYYQGVLAECLAINEPIFNRAA